MTIRKGQLRCVIALREASYLRYAQDHMMTIIGSESDEEEYYFDSSKFGQIVHILWDTGKFDRVFISTIVSETVIIVDV